jgi:tripartite ATP-independent transporter DctM subunit
MNTLSPHAMPLLMSALLLGAILIGYPVSLALAGTATLFVLVSDLPLAFFNLMISRIYANALANWLLVAVPMFIFMGYILERSGIAERMLLSLSRLLRHLPGGLALAVLAVGVMLAATSGIVGASVVLLSVLALPQMIKAGYDRSFSAGVIAGSGTLAILIPPSIMLIVLSDQLRVPVGDLFRGAILPGMLIVGLYAAWIVLRAWRNPQVAPPAPPATDTSIINVLADILPVTLLIVCVLGSIVLGVATPTEASGLGALGALVVAAFQGRLRLSLVREASLDTARTTALVIFVVIGATCFSSVFRGIGGETMIEDGLAGLGGNPWHVLAVVMLVVFLLGFVLDWLEISLILMPLLGPIIAGLDFGNGLKGAETLAWFAILVALNLQSSFLTPPFGFTLFYLRSTAPEHLSNRDIYVGVIPIIALQLLAVLLCAAVPALVTWRW